MAETTMTAPAPSAPATQPPGPKGLPLIGVLPQFGRRPLGFLTDIAREYGDLVRLPLGDRPTYLLSDPATIEYVHTHTGREFDKGYGTDPLLGNGLVNSEGEFWRRQRRLVQPAFHHERIAAYGEAMVGRTEQMVTAWRDGEQRDIHAEMMVLTLGIVAQTLFDADVSGDAADVGEALELSLREYTREMTRIVRLPHAIPTPGRARLRSAVAQLDRIVARLIAERRASGRDRGDLLSTLVLAQDDDGAGMTDRQLRDEVMTLFLAGHETTANALTWSWVLLSRHPEAEATLLAELRDVLDGRAATVADVPRLRYAEAVITEAMRLCPPVWLVSRRAARSTEVGGYRLPEGADLWMSQWVTHRDPRFFLDPLTFDPERWLDDRAKGLPRFAYFPFGGGPRKCIGASFAMMEATLILATVARRFRLRVDGSIALEASMTLRPKRGVLATLAAR